MKMGFQIAEAFRYYGSNRRQGIYSQAI